MPSQSEHIFRATEITALAEEWKKLNAQGRHQEAMPVLEKIVVMSSAMFEALAQHEEYHRTVDLQILVVAAQEKVVKWLLHWNPTKGKIFSFFSKCAKNAFRSELQKVNLYRTRFHTTSVDLEKYYGVEDHESDRQDVAAEFHVELKKLTCRWGCPQEQGALRFLIECVLDQENHDRHQAIRTASYAYGLGPDLAKFFYWWVLTALRNIHMSRIHIPFTEQELILHANSYSQFAELFDICTFEQLKQMIAVLGGTRIPVPTMTQVAKLIENHRLAVEIAATDMTPEEVAAVGRKYKRSPRSAQQVFEEMTETMDARRSGEHYVYEQYPDEPHA